MPIMAECLPAKWLFARNDPPVIRQLGQECIKSPLSLLPAAKNSDTLGNYSQALLNGLSELSSKGHIY